MKRDCFIFLHICSIREILIKMFGKYTKYSIQTMLNKLRQQQVINKNKKEDTETLGIDNQNKLKPQYLRVTELVNDGKS